MHKIQEFFSWFSKQKNSGKLAIGCASTFIFCCFCALTNSIFSESSPTPPIINSPIVSQTESSVETPTSIALTNTSSPSTSIPTPTSTEIELLVDIYSILGKSTNEVEAIIGQTTLITPNDDSDDNLSGGEYRDYIIGKYTVFIAYDKNGVSRVFQILDGLSNENYSLSQWSEILPLFGFNINTPPERTSPQAIYWDNYNGYFIAIFGDPVWSVQIAEFEYHP